MGVALPIDISIKIISDNFGNNLYGCKITANSKLKTDGAFSVISSIVNNENPYFFSNGEDKSSISSKKDQSLINVKVSDINKIETIIDKINQNSFFKIEAFDMVKASIAEIKSRSSANSISDNDPNIPGSYISSANIEPNGMDVSAENRYASSGSRR